MLEYWYKNSFPCLKEENEHNMAEFPMHRAVAHGDFEKVRELIHLGMYLNGHNTHGETPLIVAAENGRREIFDLLLQYGAQVDCGKDYFGWTPLHWVSSEGWVDQVRRILEKGSVDVNAAGNQGDTPLILAAENGHKEIFDLLIQYGAQVDCGRDYHGWTPLHWVSSKGWVDQVRRILEKGSVDVNAASNRGDTPLLVAARKGHKEIFVLLFQYGAHVNCGSWVNTWVVLYTCCY